MKVKHCQIGHYCLIKSPTFCIKKNFKTQVHISLIDETIRVNIKNCFNKALIK